MKWLIEWNTRSKEFTYARPYKDEDIWKGQVLARFNSLLVGVEGETENEAKAEAATYIRWWLESQIDCVVAEGREAEDRVAEELRQAREVSRRVGEWRMDEDKTEADEE